MYETLIDRIMLKLFAGELGNAWVPQDEKYDERMFDFENRYENMTVILDYILLRLKEVPEYVITDSWVSYTKRLVNSADFTGICDSFIDETWVKVKGLLDTRLRVDPNHVRAALGMAEVSDRLLTDEECLKALFDRMEGLLSAWAMQTQKLPRHGMYTLITKHTATVRVMQKCFDKCAEDLSKHGNITAVRLSKYLHDDEFKSRYVVLRDYVEKLLPTLTAEDYALMGVDENYADVPDDAEVENTMEFEDVPDDAVAEDEVEVEDAEGDFEDVDFDSFDVELTGFSDGSEVLKDAPELKRTETEDYDAEYGNVADSKTFDDSPLIKIIRKIEFLQKYNPQIGVDTIVKEIAPKFKANDTEAMLLQQVKLFAGVVNPTVVHLIGAIIEWHWYNLWED